MAVRRTKKKIDIKTVVTKALVVGGTGVVAHVAAEAIDLKNPSYVDYGLMAAGVILPEVIKSPELEACGDALLAVGAYRLAERNDLAGKLGLNTAANAGLPGQYTIGAGWVPTANAYAQESLDDEKKNPQKVVS